MSAICLQSLIFVHAILVAFSEYLFLKIERLMVIFAVEYFFYRQLEKSSPNSFWGEFWDSSEKQGLVYISFTMRKTLVLLYCCSFTIDKISKTKTASKTRWCKSKINLQTRLKFLLNRNFVFHQCHLRSSLWSMFCRIAFLKSFTNAPCKNHHNWWKCFPN